MSERGIQNMKINLRKPKGVRITKSHAVCGGHKVPLLILSPETGAKDAPGVLWIHGGGYIAGMKEMAYMSRAVDLVREFGAVAVSPGYRLAWLHPFPAALDDCYAALLWMNENCVSLGIRPDRLIVGGESAGGGLAAAVCMRARDEKRVRIAFQLPLYPMLDNLDTESSRDNHGRVWNTRKNHIGWRVFLRSDAKKEVTPYASPARQTDYAGLPPCYTFVGDGEPFFAETLAYVENLRKAGVEARCDVYHTDIHAFDMLHPELDVSKRAVKAFQENFAAAMKSVSAPR